MDTAGGRLLVIAGPTASGKTAVALSLARALGGELIGADSVQVYRRLDLGSAKPTPAELDGIPHHLLDVVGLDEPFDAARYIAEADAAIAAVRTRGRVPIVVGGTGLYLRALVRGLASGIPADPAVRARLHARIAAGGREALAGMHGELAAVDPDYARAIQPTDPIRIVRALEVWEVSGLPLSEHHRRHARQPPRYEARLLALEVPRPTLRERIAVRTRAMLAAGWIDEVAGLLAEGFDPMLKPLRSVGYAEIVDLVLGRRARADLETAIANSTWAFAKRQGNWFRSEPGMRWVAPEALVDAECRADLERFLSSSREDCGPARNP